MASFYFESELKPLFCSTPVVVQFVVQPSVQVPSESRMKQRDLSEQLEAQVRSILTTKGISADSLFFSRSHSQFNQLMSAIVIGSTERIGIDLENLNRKVHPKVGARIIHESEGSMQLSVLEFWVIKEAAFKCNLDNFGTVVPQYQVISWDSQLRQGEVRFVSKDTLHKNRDFQVKLVQVDSWLIAVAKGK